MCLFLDACRTVTVNLDSTSVCGHCACMSVILECSIVQLPEASTWLQAYEAMLEFLFSTDIERQPKSALQSMRTLSDPSLKFSERYCR